MKIRIGRKDYHYSVAFSVLLKYISIFGTSYLRTFFESEEVDPLALVRLVWCSISNAPRFDIFLKIISKDKKFVNTAHTVQSQILGSMPSAETNNDENTDSSDMDELDILAAIIVADAVELIDKLPVFMIINTISRKTNLLSSASGVNNAPKFRKMTPKQINELYGGGK